MRKCATCGKLVTAGMTDQYGDFYAHEGKCFNQYMNKTYGKHQWMELGAEDALGGYYIYTDDTNNAGYNDTGIFYTEWN